MYDYEKAKALASLIKESGYNCALAKEDESSDYHLMVVLDDFKEDHPMTYFKFQFDQDEYYIHLDKFIKIDIDNDNEYYEILQIVNYQNSANSLWRWYIDKDGYVGALYTPFEIFDREVDYYGGLFDVLMDEIYDFLEL